MAAHVGSFFKVVDVSSKEASLNDSIVTDVVKDLHQEGIRAQLERDLAEPQAYDCCNAESTSLELCFECQLPLGDFRYFEEGECKRAVHGECKAHMMLRKLQKEADAKKKGEEEAIQRSRAEYEIGWKIDRIPNNIAAAARLDVGFEPKSMVCLILEDSKTVRVAPTTDPAYAVNLEYLSLALRVRREEGREPLFSLDPLDNVRGREQHEKTFMQKLKYEPDWLAGTSVGEVMFQADYHLKELALGVCDQPIVGMKSCLDYADREDSEADWSAREWFIIRKAEILMSEDRSLMPWCKMGVEAREQFWADSGLEDAKITRPDHPLVKYAAEFTRNFDLIAERKSVVHQLREVAKASVLAKFLTESGVHLDDSWYNLADEPRGGSTLEIPQVKNARFHSKIIVQDGVLIEKTDESLCAKWNRVYGGVEFGVDRFELRAPKPAAARLAAAGIAQISAPPTISRGLAPSIAMMARVGAPLAAAVGAVPPRAFSAARLAARPVASVGVAPAAGLRMSVARAPRPEGVDLSLDQFDLNQARLVSSQAAGASWGLDSSETMAGAAFWKTLDANDSSLSGDQKKLLKSIFNPHLSDRREEGDLFNPPDRSFDYVEKLQNLTKEEEVLRARRIEHFCSTRFVTGDAGRLFPASWTASHKVIGAANEQRFKLSERPGYAEQAEVLKTVLAAVVPVFDRRTEDGMRFRIYQSGTLEVRTHQEHNGREVVGAVFSVSPLAEAAAACDMQCGSVEPDETFQKAALYVASGACRDAADRLMRYHRYFAVLEAKCGRAIVIEKLMDGAMKWEVEPRDLAARREAARCLRTSDCRQSFATVADVSNLREELTEVSAEGCRIFAHGIYEVATGELRD